MAFLDLRTIVSVGFVTALICTLLLLGLWRQNRGHFAGTGFWCADLAFQLAALVLIVLRGRIPDWASMVVANTLVVAGAWVGYLGLERFMGRRGPQRHNLLLIAAFAGLHAYFTYGQPSLELRNLNLAVALLILFAQCLFLLWYRVEPWMRAWTWGVALVFLGYCLVSLARMLHYAASTSAGEDYFHSGPFEIAVFVAYLSLFILFTFSLSLMVNRRLQLEVDLEREKFYKAFHSSPYAMTLTRLEDGVVFEVNDGFRKITGYEPQEVLGRRVRDLHLWRHPEKREALVAELSRTGRVQGRELEFSRKKGDVLTGLCSMEIIELKGARCILSSTADITERKQAEQERERLIQELQVALSRIRTLSGLLPICASCKKIRNDAGQWEPVETYVRDRSEAEFSHGLCPDCLKSLYPEILKD